MSMGRKFAARALVIRALALAGLAGTLALAMGGCASQRADTGSAAIA